jgi:threonine/homoserine/homoserine lactone efflux protein
MEGKLSWRGIVTAVAVILALLALDDITTDTASSFALERAMVVACGAWLAYMALRMWRRRLGSPPGPR